MSEAGQLPYKIRPNKAVDREIFLSFLALLDGIMPIRNYKYIGLGGPFLEDFRLVYARVGISDMISVEQEEAVHLRQKFNRPLTSIECIHQSLDDYLGETEFGDPLIMWLDYTSPGSLREQIDTFCEQATHLPVNSVLRITLNANPSSLGKPEQGEAINLQEYRLCRLQKRLAEYVPVDFDAGYLFTKEYGKGLLKILGLAVERGLEGYVDRKALWAFATHYSDGQPMITATLVIVGTDDNVLVGVIEDWSFYSTIEMPHVLDLPALSTMERLTIEASNDPEDSLGYSLPDTGLGKNSLEIFQKFRRVYPHFTRVDL